MSFFSEHPMGHRIIDMFLSNSMLCSLIDEYYRIYDEKTAWEFWLNRETGKCWADFKAAVIPVELIPDMDKIADVQQTLMKGGIF